MTSRRTRLVTLERFVQPLIPLTPLTSTSKLTNQVVRQCAIQDCLTRNGYNEAKCTKFVDALYECCKAFYEKNGDDATTVSCPKAHLLRLKMEQRKDNT